MTIEKNMINHKATRHGKTPAIDNSSIKQVKLFSTNCAGLVNGKVDSLKNEVKQSGATIVTLQETHFLRKGRLVLNNMVVFEAIGSRKGGGTLCAINE